MKTAAFAVPAVSNPEAGAHAVTHDPVEIEAVLAAGERTWIEFPYYERRFGERGRRFCGSDSAWLVTLCNGSRAEALRQVRWLGLVLASRGMPRYLLERHLINLHDALIAAAPHERKRYAVLRYCGEQLAAARTAQIDAVRFDAIAKRFNVRTRGPQAIAAFGELLVSAVADEGDGIARAVETIEPWATNGEQFDAAWIAAVRSTIAAARRERRA